MQPSQAWMSRSWQRKEKASRLRRDKILSSQPVLFPPRVLSSRACWRCPPRCGMSLLSCVSSWKLLVVAFWKWCLVTALPVTQRTTDITLSWRPSSCNMTSDIQSHNILALDIFLLLLYFCYSVLLVISICCITRPGSLWIPCRHTATIPWI